MIFLEWSTFEIWKVYIYAIAGWKIGIGWEKVRILSSKQWSSKAKTKLSLLKLDAKFYVIKTKCQKWQVDHIPGSCNEI